MVIAQISVLYINNLKSRWDSCDGLLMISICFGEGESQREREIEREGFSLSSVIGTIPWGGTSQEERQLTLQLHSGRRLGDHLTVSIEPLLQMGRQSQPRVPPRPGMEGQPTSTRSR